MDFDIFSQSLDISTLDSNWICTDSKDLLKISNISTIFINIGLT